MYGGRYFCIGKRQKEQYLQFQTTCEIDIMLVDVHHEIFCRVLITLLFNDKKKNIKSSRKVFINNQQRINRSGWSHGLNESSEAHSAQTLSTSFSSFQQSLKCSGRRTVPHFHRQSSPSPPEQLAKPSSGPVPLRWLHLLAVQIKNSSVRAEERQSWGKYES